MNKSGKGCLITVVVDNNLGGCKSKCGYRFPRASPWESIVIELDISPLAETTAETPELVPQTKGRRTSIARDKVIYRCCQGSCQFPNQLSLETLIKISTPSRTILRVNQSKRLL